MRESTCCSAMRPGSCNCRPSCTVRTAASARDTPANPSGNHRPARTRHRSSSGRTRAWCRRSECLACTPRKCSASTQACPIRDSRSASGPPSTARKFWTSGRRPCRPSSACRSCTQRSGSAASRTHRQDTTMRPCTPRSAHWRDKPSPLAAHTSRRSCRPASLIGGLPHSDWPMRHLLQPASSQRPEMSAHSRLR